MKAAFQGVDRIHLDRVLLHQEMAMDLHPQGIRREEAEKTEGLIR